MSSAATSSRWTARLAWALLLLAVGSGAAIWMLGQWPSAARFFAVGDKPEPTSPATLVARPVPQPGDRSTRIEPETREDRTKVAELEERISGVEQQSAEVVGSAGRADALLIAFAARRAIERGMSLGYLEPLLTQRFGPRHPAAVARLIRFARAPVTREQLIDRFDVIAPGLDTLGGDESWLSRLRGELADTVSIRRADQPPTHRKARVARAKAALDRGNVDVAVAELLRLRGADQVAKDWLAQARRYLEAQQALDEVEAAALNGEISAVRATSPLTRPADAKTPQ